MSSKEDLQFLTTDMSDDYNEASAAPAAPLFGHEAEDAGMVGKLGLFKGSRHPGAALFHVLFKALAVLTYCFAGAFTSNFVLVCVLCILLLAFDFWTVKNVSGRLLVGLRWWNYVKEDGATEWVFESTEDLSEIADADRRLFWAALYAPAAVWGLFLLTALIGLKLQWLIVIAAAIALSGANIVGYTKCSKEARQRLETFAAGGVASSIMSQVGVGAILSGLGSAFARGAAGAAAQPDAQPQTGFAAV